MAGAAGAGAGGRLRCKGKACAVQCRVRRPEQEREGDDGDRTGDGNPVRPDLAGRFSSALRLRRSRRAARGCRTRAGPFLGRDGRGARDPLGAALHRGARRLARHHVAEVVRRWAMGFLRSSRRAARARTARRGRPAVGGGRWHRAQSELEGSGRRSAAARLRASGLGGGAGRPDRRFPAHAARDRPRDARDGTARGDRDAVLLRLRRRGGGESPQRWRSQGAGVCRRVLAPRQGGADARGSARRLGALPLGAASARRRPARCFAWSAFGRRALAGTRLRRPSCRWCAARGSHRFPRRDAVDDPLYLGDHRQTQGRCAHPDRLCPQGGPRSGRGLRSQAPRSHPLGHRHGVDDGPLARLWRLDARCHHHLVRGGSGSSRPAAIVVAGRAAPPDAPGFRADAGAPADGCGGRGSAPSRDAGDATRVRLHW